MQNTDKKQYKWRWLELAYIFNGGTATTFVEFFFVMSEDLL
jgi:hypothetical protein